MNSTRLSAQCLLVSAVIVLSLTLSVSAQTDRFPELPNTERDQTAEPMPPEEAAAGLRVPAELRVQLFASEPDVQNPIAMTWDAAGRLWIAENYTYAERPQRFDLSLRDRVIVLEDSNGDGTADRRTVFTDQVQMLTSLEVGRGGVWLMCPPRLLFIPDANHDLQPDGPARVVLDGFEVAKENYHNFANGLRFGPDGWLYGRCGGSCPGRVGTPGTPDDQRVALEGGLWRYHPTDERFEVLTHGTTNPWGHDWDQWGEAFFVNTVNGHLWHLIPGAHLMRPFTLDPNPNVYELIDMHADHWHFDTGGSWQQSRDGAANEYGGGHAHCGTMIYLGDNWPESYRGRLLTWNLHGRRANQELLERHGSGYVAKHGPDILLSSDPFFRGMDLSYGPDGAVYAIDWSDTGECHENTGVHRTSGRVFRISAKEPLQPTGPGRDLPSTNLHDLDDEHLVALHTHRNEWYVRQARLLLAERFSQRQSQHRTPDNTPAIQQLQEMLQPGNPLLTCRALQTLHAMGLTTRALVEPLLGRDNEHVRVWAVRVLTDEWPLDDVFGPTFATEAARQAVHHQSTSLLPVLQQQAATDKSSLVRLALASTLQRLPLQLRPQLAAALVARPEDDIDHNLPLLVWYGLMPVADAHPQLLAELAGQCRWAKTQRLMTRRLGQEIARHPDTVDTILRAATTTRDAATRLNLLQGLTDGLRGWSRVTPPGQWSSFVKALPAKLDQPTALIVRDLNVLFGDGRALNEVRSIVLDADADISIRRSALQTFVNAGGPDVSQVCLELLNDPRLNTIAAQGLARTSDPQVARALIKNYRRFRAPQRPKVISLLVSRELFATELLDAIEEQRIPTADLTAYDVRQIRSLNDPKLQKRVAELWGEVRETPEARRQLIEKLKQQLTVDALEHANPQHGRLLFQKSCAKCHRLFGQGEMVGPDLTGANRSNLDYLLENVVDPSAVVSRDFRMTVVALHDGRVLNGLVLARNDQTLTLQTQTDKLTLLLKDIDETRLTTQSPMPDGLLDNLSEQDIRDLVSYLMQPAQVSLPAAQSGQQ